MRYPSLTLLLLFLISNVPTAAAQDYDTLIKQAATAYDIGEYFQSGKLYEQAFALAEPKGEHLYMAARSFIRAARPDEAFAYLSRVLDRGDRPLFRFLLEDQNLIPLHSDPRWNAFRESVDQKLAQEQNPPLNLELRAELLRMVEVDQRAREKWMSYIQKGLPPPDTLVFEIMGIDSANTARMKEIVARYGWLGRSLVGDDGAHNAWLLVQHADRDPDFQKQVLGLLREAVKKGEASGQDLAYLTDRVLRAEGKPQMYGTQLHMVDGKLVPQPIEDEANVDKRRAEVGLMPLSEYLRFARGEN